MKRYRTAILLYTLIVYLFMGRASGATVLCVGDNGHVALESPALHDCATLDTAPSGPVVLVNAAAAPSGTVAPCGTCVDTYLGTHNARQADGAEPQGPGDLARLQPLAYSAMLLALPGPRPARAGLRSPADRAHRRTTVLLI